MPKIDPHRGADRPRRTPRPGPAGPARRTQPLKTALLSALLAALLSVGLALPAAAAADEAPAAPAAGDTPAAMSPADPVAALQAEIATMKREYEQRIADLEARLAALEAERAPTQAGQTGQSEQAGKPTEQPAGTHDELAALRAAAQAAAGTSATEAAAPAQEEPAAPTYGRERDLNKLNPEISLTGNVLGIASDAGPEEFRTQEFELNVQSPLDPFSLTKWTLSVHDGGVDVEEGYVDYSALGHGLKLTAGKFRQSFGILNRWHGHALPQVEYPLVIQQYLGEEGLAQTGLSLDWVLPRGWADTNTLTFQVTDGSSPIFGGRNFDRLTYLGRLSNYWDLSPATYFEVGFSGLDGETAEGGTSRVWGTDLTLDWAPPGRAKYREVRWRTELMRSERDDPAGIRQDAWGGYSYLEGLLARNLWAGVRYDRVEDPLDPSQVREAIVPYVTWWQSEFVRLRGEYQMFTDAPGGVDSNTFTLQLTWAAGPHKHENY